MSLEWVNIKSQGAHLLPEESMAAMKQGNAGRRRLFVIAVMIVAGTFLSTAILGVIMVPKWRGENIGVFAGFVEKSFLAQDSQGLTHVLFVGDDRGYYNIRHGVRSGDHWDLDTVYVWKDDPTRSRIFSATMDSQDRIHVSTIEVNTRQIMHLFSDHGQWNVENVTLDGEPRSPSIAVDRSGHVYMLTQEEWYDGSEVRRNLTIVTDEAGYWNSEKLAEDTDATDARVDSLIVDSSGNIHALISFWGGTSLFPSGRHTALVYGVGNSSNWSFSLIDTSAKNFGLPSMVLDSFGKAHVLYYSSPGTRAADGSSYYLNYSTNADGSWKTTRLWDVGNFYPEGTDLMFDSSGVLHAAFCSNYFYQEPRSFNNTLWHAVKSGGNWTKEVIVGDIGGLMGGAEPSLIVDSNSNIQALVCIRPDTGWSMMTLVTNEYSSAPYIRAVVISAAYAAIPAGAAGVLFLVLRWRDRMRFERQKLWDETGLNG